MTKETRDMSEERTLTPPSRRQSLLERLVEQRTSEAFLASIGVAVQKVAEEIAKEALADETFRRAICELVKRRSEALLQELLDTERKEVTED
jgi:hypothetical protein